MEAYTDANWTGSINDMRSTFGMCTSVGGNLITWHNKKQFVVSWNSAEAEYMAVANGLYELLWLEKLLAELKD